MDPAKPSLARRALALVVLAVVVVVALRIVVGAITAVFWIVALVVLAIAALWAVSTLKSAKRARGEARAGRPSSSERLPTAPPEDRVEAQMRQIKEQLRDQGRL
jgi:hypothetical protein